MIIKVIYGQTLMDVSIERYGSAMALIDLANDNGLAADEDVFAGQELFIRDSYPETAIPIFSNYLIENKTKVLSGQGGDTELIQVLSTNDDEIITDNDNAIEI